MHTKIQLIIADLISEYCLATDTKNIWEYPVVKFCDTTKLDILKKIVIENHFIAEDFLKNPKTIVSYYLPFKKEIGKSNLENRLSSKEWAEAYVVTNNMAKYINKNLVVKIESMGHRAAVPENIGMLEELLMSRWSQRHIAWLAGHGTFGINNMLISEVGCCGRYFSIVTDLTVIFDEPIEIERCLNCGLCVKRCVTGALKLNGFDRKLCHAICLENENIVEGAEVCGKCVVELPCSYKCP